MLACNVVLIMLLIGVIAFFAVLATQGREGFLSYVIIAALVFFPVLLMIFVVFLLCKLFLRTEQKVGRVLAKDEGDIY